MGKHLIETAVCDNACTVVREIGVRKAPLTRFDSIDIARLLDPGDKQRDVVLRER